MYLGAGRGIRTLSSSLEDWRATVTLYPHIVWPGKRDSNSHRADLEAAVLPIRTIPRRLLICFFWGVGRASNPHLSDSQSEPLPIKLPTPSWTLRPESNWYPNLRRVLYCPLYYREFWSVMRESSPHFYSRKVVSYPLNE